MKFFGPHRPERVLLRRNTLYIPNIRDQEMWVHQDQRFSSISSTREPNAASFQSFWGHPRVPTSIILVSDTPKRHCQFGTFSNLGPNGTSSNCLSHERPASGCPYKFRSRRTTESSMSAQDSGHPCRGRRIHKSGLSDFGFLSNLGASSSFTCVYTDTASAACPSQSGNLAITSISFAAVIWDADEPCSEKTAWAPESSFTMSPRSTTLPVNFCNFGSNSGLCPSV